MSEDDQNGDGSVTIDDFASVREEANKPPYSPFHPGLDKKYPVDDLLFPEDREKVVKGKTTPLGWVRTFSLSPIGNGEAESIMGKVVEAAIRAGQWVDVPIKKNESLGQVHGVDWNVTLGTAKWEWTTGANLLFEHEWAERVLDDDGREWLAPKEEMLRYITGKLKPRSTK